MEGGIRARLDRIWSLCSHSIAMLREGNGRSSAQETSVGGFLQGRTWIISTHSLVTNFGRWPSGVAGWIAAGRSTEYRRISPNKKGQAISQASRLNLKEGAITDMFAPGLRSSSKLVHGAKCKHVPRNGTKGEIPSFRAGNDFLRSLIGHEFMRLN